MEPDISRKKDRETTDHAISDSSVLLPGNQPIRAALLAVFIVTHQQPATSSLSTSSSEIVGIDEAITLSGKSKATIRNRLSARDPLLLAARLPGKAYRFNRTRFMKWIDACQEYAALPGIKRSRTRG